jgi:hypothetical protein
MLNTFIGLSHGGSLIEPGAALLCYVDTVSQVIRIMKGQFS